MKIKNISNRKSESISADSMRRNIRMMHEQLFSHLDNMNMLFSPIFQNLSPFVWDDTRSVRSNIYGFIDSYYQIALGAARIIKENQCTRTLFGYNTQIDVREDYTRALIEICEGFLVEALIKGYDYPEMRFSKKVEAARTLYVYR